VIKDTTNTPYNIRVENYPVAVQAFRNFFSSKIYVANAGSNNVSVIKGTSYPKKAYDIHVGITPMDMVFGLTSTKTGYPKIYVANAGSNNVSVINSATDKKEPHDIPVGITPSRIAYDSITNVIYVINRDSNTVSVINGFSDNIAAGVILNVNPANPGRIICNNTQYPTNIYLYVDTGTNCIAQPNKGFEFNTWVESPLTNGNSSIPLDSSGNLTVNRYGRFTVSFKPVPPTIPSVSESSEYCRITIV